MNRKALEDFTKSTYSEAFIWRICLGKDELYVWLTNAMVIIMFTFEQ